MKILSHANRLLICTLAINFIILPSVNANQTSFNVQDYKYYLTQGHQAFKAKQYTHAIQYYQQAQAIEPLDSTLYNIAVCYFKSKQWSLALNHFKQIEIDDESATVVTYNIAVTYKKLGQDKLAQQTFEHILRWAEDDKLLNLANQQLKSLNTVHQQQASQAKEQNKSFLALPDDYSWQALLNISYGNDNNVLQPDDDSASNTSDQFIESLATASLMKKNNWSLDLLYYGSQYQQANDYDISLISLSGRKYFPLSDNEKLYIALSTDQIKLAGQPYISNQKLTLGYKIKLDDTNSLKIESYLKRVNDDDTAYEYIAGNSARLAIKWWLGQNGNKWNDQWSLGAKLTADRRNDRLTDTSFTSYSTNRLLFSVGKAWQWRDWHVGVNANYRLSRYVDPNKSTIDAGLETETTTSIERTDKRFYISLESEYTLSENWSITGEINKTDNSSNIENYVYDQQNMMIGLSYQF